MNKPKPKKLPVFKNIEEESDFWDKTCTEDYLSEDVTEEFLSEMKKHAKTKTKVTLRFDDELLNNLKTAAKKNGVPYQRFAREILKMGLSKLKV